MTIVLPVFAEPIQLILVECDWFFLLFNGDADIVGCSILDQLHQFISTLQCKHVLPTTTQAPQVQCQVRMPSRITGAVFISIP